MSTKAHKVLAVLGTLAVIAIPCIAHSVYGGDAHVQQVLTMLAMLLGVLGFTVAKPLISGDPEEWKRTHKTLATIGTLLVVAIPVLSRALGASPPVKLALDFVGAVLAAAGFVAVRPAAGGAQASALLPLAFVCVSLSGCVLSTTPKGATTIQKWQADVAAAEKVGADIKAQCGPKFASFSPTLASFLSIAADPTNILSDIIEAAKLVPELKGDFDAFACVVTVIQADWKTLKPHAARMVRLAFQYIVATEMPSSIPMLTVLDVGYYDGDACWPSGTAPRCKQQLPDAPAMAPAIESQ